MKQSKRILALLLGLCLLISLVPAMAIGAAAAGTRTIYFDNSVKNWSEVAVYTWNGDGPFTGQWPGSLMNEVEDGVYSYEVPVDATKIIFNNNNNGEQTGDLDMPTDEKNLCDGTNWYIYGTPIVRDEPTYYLVGYINDRNYGCEDDSANTGIYKFVDGKLTANFDSDSYVFVKTGDNAHWYLTEAFCTDTTCTLAEGNGEKMFVPGNQEVTFTLTKNADGTLTLSYTESVCTEHLYSSVVATKPGCETEGNRVYTCGICGDTYNESIPATGHTYSNGSCFYCGAADPSVTPTTTEYYLFGYINGADYGIGDNSDNLGEYKFVNGKLTVTFTETSYVAVKTGDNKNWYMTNGWQGEVTSVTLMNFSDPYAASANKLMVPGGQQITFTLTTKWDGNLTLSYTVPTTSCKHSSHNQDGICVDCGATVNHKFSMGVCTICNAIDPSYDPCEYYLFGYINGEDFDSLNNYKFQNGKLTVTFEQDSYIGVKKVNPNGKYGPEVLASYMTQGWAGEVTSTTLYNTYILGNADKLLIPGNVEVTISISNITDDTMDISYTTGTSAPSTTPTLKAEYPTVSFEDVIVMNIYFSASNTQDVVEMGLMTFNSKVANPSASVAVDVIPGYTWNESVSMNVASTNGIAAKELGKTIYFAVYAKLRNGNYAFSTVQGYSVLKYATKQLQDGNAATKALMVATLNYGAAAQKNFGYNTSNLVNASLTSAQKALVKSYSSSMISTAEKPSTSKLGAMQNNGGYEKRYATVSFEGAFSINYYFAPSAAPKGNITMYVWTQAAYNAASSLSKNNASYAITMVKQDNGEYLGTIEGIAAKQLNDAVYVSFCYSDGNTNYCSGVNGYSIGQYCKSQASGTGTMAELAKATAVYGYYAKQRFG